MHNYNVRKMLFFVFFFYLGGSQFTSHIFSHNTMVSKYRRLFTEYDILSFWRMYAIMFIEINSKWHISLQFRLDNYSNLDVHLKLDVKPQCIFAWWNTVRSLIKIPIKIYFAVVHNKIGRGDFSTSFTTHLTNTLLSIWTLQS